MHGADDDKCKPVSISFSILGCNLGLCSLASGSLAFLNKEGRLESIQTMVENLRDKRNLVRMIN